MDLFDGRKLCDLVAYEVDKNFKQAVQEVPKQPGHYCLFDGNRLGKGV